MTTQKLPQKKPYATPLVWVVQASATPVRLLACSADHITICPDAIEVGCCSYSAGTCDDDCPPF